MSEKILTDENGRKFKLVKHGVTTDGFGDVTECYFVVPVPELEPARPLAEELTDRFYQDCGMNISIDGLTTETKMLCRVLDKRFKELGSK